LSCVAVGHAPLWLAGVTAVTIRDHKVLLVKRSDNGASTAVTGILEPGGNPADCAVHEVLEETGIDAQAELQVDHLEYLKKSRRVHPSSISTN
jgi:8-oxo-dGTP pyrophosphatase MutT (NUDIX family)